MTKRDFKSAAVFMTIFLMVFAAAPVTTTAAARDDKAKAAKKKKAADKEKANPELEDHFSTEYYGIETSAQRIVYVLDNSNSMKGGKFNAAANELMKSVEKMRAEQEFFVVLFSDTAYPLGHPRPVKKMLNPTEENKRDLRYWLETVELCLKTNAAPALTRALAMKPDTIFMLTDGRFTDDTLERFARVKLKGVTIHTIGLEMNRDDAIKGLKAIAKKFGGEYRDVQLDGKTKQAAAKPVRKINNGRGNIWGVTLKAGKKKKGKK